MSELNPYAKFLDDRPLASILAATGSMLSALLEKMGPSRATVAPAPGKWSPTEIVCHLADCEIAFAFRLRQTMAEENHTIQPFDQEKWAVIYPGFAVGPALAAFAALRNWNLVLIDEAMPESSERPAIHPERGAMTFRTIVETMAGHDLNHIAQLERLAR